MYGAIIAGAFTLLGVVVERVLRYSKVDVLNIPPRQFVRIELQGEFDREGVLALASEKWNRIEFVGERPKRPFMGILGSKTYRKTIERRGWNQSR